MSGNAKELEQLMETLKLFVKYAVKCFEEKLATYKAEVDVMSPQPKEGKVSKVLATQTETLVGAAAGIAVAASGIPALTTVSKQIGRGIGKSISTAMTYASTKKHKSKAIRVYEICRRVPKRELRRKLVESFLRIFIAFEYQFNEIKKNENCERNIEKIAAEMVNKMINYINRSHGLKDDVTCEVITKATLLGTSKGWASVLPKVVQKTLRVQPGLTLRHVTDSTNISELIEEVGIAKIREESLDSRKESFELFRRNNDFNGHRKFRYRLPFDWEDPSNDLAYIQVNDDEFVHSYVLVNKVAQNIVEDLLEAINQDDMELKMMNSEVRVGDLNIQFGDFKEDNRIEHKKTRQFFADIVDGFSNESHKPVIMKNLRFSMTKSVRGFTGREEEIRRLHEALQCEPTDTVISRVVVVCGLGGIGKSELCRRYAYHTHNTFYDNIIWLNAETQQILRESFEGLSKELGNKSTEETEELKNICRKIYCKFCNSKTLVIFDNAENIAGVAPGLPVTSDQGTENIFTLITSRNRNWNAGEEGNIKVLNLNTFQPEESVKYVMDMLGLQSDDGGVIEMTEELQHFPLALRQAVTYIDQENAKKSKFGECFTVRDYLRLLKDHSDILLQKGVNEMSERRYDKTVVTTWSITLDKIKQHSVGKNAIEVLQIMAYLSPDGIRVREVFESMDKIKDGIALLHDYSMINLNNGIVNIHRLVQKVTRDKQAKQEEKILSKTLKILLNSTPYCKLDPPSLSYNKHFISAWAYASKYPKLVKKFYCKFQKRHYNSPLHYFCWNGDYDNVVNILSAQVDNTKFLQFLDTYRRTPLKIATQYGHIEIVKRIYQENSLIARLGPLYDSPLITAVAYRHSNIVNFLLEEGGTHIFESNAEIVLATLIAVQRGFFDIMDSLKPVAETLSEILGNLFLKAQDVHFFKKHNERIRRLMNHLQNHYTPETLLSVEYKGKTLLDLAAYFNSAGAVSYLLIIGAEVKPQSYVLHSASIWGNVELAKLFLEKGVDPNITNAGGCSAFHFAAAGDNVNIMKLLIDYEDQRSGNVHAALNARNLGGASPLVYALIFERDEIVQLLWNKTELPINVNIEINSSSLFQYAVLCEKEELLGKEMGIIDVNVQVCSSDKVCFQEYCESLNDETSKKSSSLVILFYGSSESRVVEIIASSDVSSIFPEHQVKFQIVQLAMISVFTT